jgi:hypothetical protein
VVFERLPPNRCSFIEVLDRVLDKRIVVDARMRISVVGIELSTITAYVIVGSCESDMRHPETLGLSPRSRIASFIGE